MPATTSAGLSKGTSKASLSSNGARKPISKPPCGVEAKPSMLRPSFRSARLKSASRKIGLLAKSSASLLYRLSVRIQANLSVLPRIAQSEKAAAFLSFFAVFGARVRADCVDRGANPRQPFNVGLRILFLQIQKLSKINGCQRARRTMPRINAQDAVFVVGNQKMIRVQSNAGRAVASNRFGRRLWQRGIFEALETAEEGSLCSFAEGFLSPSKLPQPVKKEAADKETQKEKKKRRFISAFCDLAPRRRY